MDDYSKLSDSELQALYAKQQKSSVEYSKMSDAELQQALQQQQQAAQQQILEDPSRLPQPISSNPQENVRAILSSVPPSQIDGLGLSDPKMSPDFIRDFRSQTGVHPETIVLDRGTRDERFAVSPQEAMTGAVADGLLDPNFKTSDPLIYKNFENKWTQYKADMESSFLGAAFRGAASSAFPTAAATAGAAIGSAAGPVGSIGLGMGAGMAAGVLQEELFPMSSQQKAQLAFDKRQALTRNARLAGELVPSLATLRLTTNPQLFKLNPRAIRDFVAGTVLGAGVPAGIDYFQGNEFDPERFAWAMGGAAFMVPNKFGTMLFDKFARTEALATKARNKIFQDERFSGLKSAEDRAHAISRLGQYGAASEHGINPMLGEFLDLPRENGRPVENQALLKFQKALQNSAEGSAMAQRQYENQVAAAMAMEKVAGEVPTLNDQPTREWIAAEHERLNAAADQTKRDLIAQGDIEGGKIIEAAELQSKTLNEAREKGILDAEGALASANSVFTQAIEEINAARGTGGSASNRAVTLLKSLKTAAYVPVKKAYKAIPKDARTDYQSTYRAAKRASSKTVLGSLKNPPPIIQKITEKYAPRIGRGGKTILPNERISVMLGDLEAVTEEISKAVLAKENHTAKLLRQVRDGIEKDLGIAGKTYEGVKLAKQMYYEYAQKYVNGTLGDMLHVSQSLDTDLRLSEMLYSTNSGNEKFNGPQQLLMALNGAGDDLVRQQLMNDMAQNGGSTSASLEKWIKSDKITRVLDAFPFRKELEAIIIKVQDAEAVSRQKTAELAAAKKVPASTPDKAEVAKGEQIKAQARETAELRYRADQAQLASDAFTAFAGADPRNGMQAIFSSNDPVGTAAQLMQIVSRDQSGQALIGLQNAMRLHFKESVRATKALTNTAVIGETLKPDQLQVVIGKLNTALVEGSPLRAVMDTILPASEMQALDKLRAQVQYITNPFRTVSGEPITSANTAALKSVEQSLNENVIGILGKIARGGNLDRYIQNGQTKLTDMMQWLYYGVPDNKRAETAMANGFKKFTEQWFGLTGKRMEQRAAELLVDAMLNPSTIGIEALENKPASPRTRDFIRAYVIQRDQLVDQPTVLPFNSLNTAEVNLPNGKLLKDGTTGYSIQNTGKKFKVFDEKGERVGIHDTLEEARQNAVNLYNRHITNVKNSPYR